MAWKKETNYNIKNGEFRICQIKIGSVISFELFERQKAIKTGFTSIKEAISYFNELKKGK